MLDIWLYKEDVSGGCRISSTLYVKPTSIKLPLASTSMHFPSVHIHWPLAQVGRFRRLCATKRDLMFHLHRFCSELVAGDAHTLAINASRSCLDPHARSEFPRSLHHRTEPTVQFWLVLPYRYIWHECDIPSLLHRLTMQYRSQFRQAGIHDVVFRVAWSTSNKPPTSLVKQFSRV